MKTERLFVHAGIAKTGTSSIQQDLFLNRDAVHEAGVLFPDTGLFGPGHHRLAHFGYCQPLVDFSPNLFDYLDDDYPGNFIELSEARRGELLENMLVELGEEIHANDCESVVLSSEAFSNWRQAPIEMLCRMMKQRNISVHLILYVRRQDEFLESLIRQNEKAFQVSFQDDETIEALIQHNAFDFSETLSLWSSEIGRDNISIKSFAALQSSNLLITEFRSSIGIKDQTELMDFESVNRSLTRHSTEFLIEQRNTLDEAELSSLSHILEDFSEINPDKPEWRYHLSPAQRQAVIDRFQPSNFMLGINHSVDVAALFPEPAIDLNEPWTRYEGLDSNSRQQIEAYVDQRQQTKLLQDELPDD